MRSILHSLLFLVCELCYSFAFSQSPDIILTHGKIFTSDKSQLYVEAIAIRGNTVLARGSNASIEKMAGSNTQVINLQGKTVVPGFNDAHYHHSPYLEGYTVRFPEDGSEPSWAQLKDSIERVVKQQPAGTFINATMGIDVAMDTAINRSLLDRLAPAHPLLIQAYWGHVVYFNTAFMKATGISETEEDVKGGYMQRLPGTKVLTGRAYEQACNFLRQKRPTNDALFRASLQDLGKEALYFGVTSIQNMCTGASPEKYIEMLEGSPIPVRFRLIRWATMKKDGSLYIPAKNMQSVVKSLPLVTLSGTKWMMDGTPIERLAWYASEYKDQPGWKGRMNFTAKESRAILAELRKRRDQPLFHAVGDGTIGFILNEMNASPQSWSARRVRLEHGDALVPGLYELAKKLNVIVVQNPSHFTIDKVLKQRYGPDLTEHAEPVKSLINAGIPVALGSDGPMNPYLNIMFACMHPFNPKEALSVEEAVIAYTKTSAYAEGADNKGTLAPGKLADLAVLSQDIFSVPLHQLPGTHSVLTIVNGKVVFKK
jgi:predicted amidohydrolase YtcJ